MFHHVHQQVGIMTSQVLQMVMKQIHFTLMELNEKSEDHEVFGIILSGTYMSKQHFIAIHPIDLEVFKTGQKGEQQTDRHDTQTEIQKKSY